jgi:hypothetical protein
MTKLLEQAIEKLRSLPEDKQDTVAGFLLAELEADSDWDRSSIRYADKLRQLADEAREDFRSGRTTELDPDSL